jgi:hypothetical protein
VLFNIALFGRLFGLGKLSFKILDEDFLIEQWVWSILKKIYLVSLIISWSFISYTFYQLFIKKTTEKSTFQQVCANNEMKLLIGNSVNSTLPIYIPESGLYQNILITGTIGSGKTSSAMYPFVEQLLKYNVGMLILDVKGNFYNKVLELNEKYLRDILVIEVGGKYTYNPLDKPNLKPSILANRLRTILTLFSNQQVTDTYWLDKVEHYLTECIKLCRLYNSGYVTFVELHKLINNSSYLEEKISLVKTKFLSNTLNSQQIFDFNTSLDFFQNEYKTLDSKILSIIQSEITRITQVFVNDYEISKTFCPQKENISFSGFENLGSKIIVLNMNLASYRSLAKIIATYLKLDFQSEVLMRLATPHKISSSAFICDEYHEYATINDADFFAQSREAKCINIVSTQSYNSLLYSIKDASATKVIIQNLVNKIWFRTYDIFTIEEAQKQLGKEDKTKISRSISENAKETKFNYILNTFKSDDSSLSESVSTYTQHDYIFDINTFSRDLRTFQAVCFLSDGLHILKPQVVQLLPIHQTNNATKNNKYI